MWKRRGGGGIEADEQAVVQIALWGYTHAVVSSPQLDVCGRAFPVEIFQFTAQFTSLRFSPSDLLPIYYFELLDAGLSGRPWL